MSITGREVYVIDVDDRGSSKVKLLNAALDRLDSNTRRTADGIERMEAAQRAAARATSASTTAINESRLSLLSLDAGLNIAARGLGLLQKGFSAFKEPVKLAVDTQSAVNALRTLSDQIGPELEAQLKALPAQIGQSTQQTLKSAYDALSAGIREQDLVGVLKQAGDLARAGQSDLTDTLGLLRVSLKAYEAQGLSATQVSDVLFATVRKGVTTIPELAASFGNVVGTAGQYGASLEEVAAATAELTKIAPTTSEAVTQLNALFKAFAAPSAKAQKTLKALGVEFGIGAIKAKGLTGILDDVQRATGGNAEVLGTLFQRQEATRALLTLLANGQAGYKDALEATTGAAGATAKATAVMNSGAAKTLKQFEALKEQALIVIGEQLLPLVNDGLRELTAYFKGDGRKSIEDFARAVAVLGRGLATVAGAAATALNTLQQVGAAIGNTAGSIYVAAEDGIARIRGEIEQAAAPLRELEAVSASTIDTMNRAINGASDTFNDFRAAIDGVASSALATVEFDRLTDDAISAAAVLGTDLLGAFNVVTGALNSGDDALKDYVAALSQVGSEAAATALPIFEVAAAVDALFAATLKQSPRKAVKPKASARKAGAAPDPFEGQGAALVKALLDQFKQAEAIQDRNDRNRLGAIESQNVRELTLLDLRFKQELRTAERAGDDLGAVQARQAREFADAARSAGEQRLRTQVELAQLSASFEQDEFAQRRLLLDIERDETLARVELLGGSLIDATAAFERRRTDIAREQSEARIRALQAEVNAAGELAGSLITLGDAIAGADSRQSGLRIALEAAVLGAKASSAGAESAIEFARGNVFKGAALAAASAAAGIEALKLGAKAVGFGGGGSSGSGGGSAPTQQRGSVERAAPAQPQRSDPGRPIVINAGIVVGERGVRELAGLIAPDARRYVEGRNGFIGEAAS